MVTLPVGGSMCHRNVSSLPLYHTTHNDIPKECNIFTDPSVFSELVSPVGNALSLFNAAWTDCPILPYSYISRSA